MSKAIIAIIGGALATIGIIAAVDINSHDNKIKSAKQKEEEEKAKKELSEKAENERLEKAKNDAQRLKEKQAAAKEKRERETEDRIEAAKQKARADAILEMQKKPTETQQQ